MDQIWRLGIDDQVSHLYWLNFCRAGLLAYVMNPDSIQRLWMVEPARSKMNFSVNGDKWLE
jgi:hypothetical protein